MWPPARRETLAMPIYVLDEMAVPPGRRQEVRTLIDEAYRPGAGQRGLRFERMCITPPLELDDEPTTLLLWWSLPDAAGFWAAKRGAVSDPAVSAFWSQVDRVVASRSRRFLAPLDVPQADVR
jgi:hypothetical protein